ncbi:DUF1674 domain-containing protein [Sphingomonas antarctica]|uniref:DUF1674 domain-containing protein n=1 Tax=Sphingomonas antarctica TaxID=2040274 RepID=UPI0039ED3691
MRNAAMRAGTPLASSFSGSDIVRMNSKRPPHVKPPAYLTPSPPLPAPEAVAEQNEHGGPKGLEPTRYGDWENNGIAWDF